MYEMLSPVDSICVRAEVCEITILGPLWSQTFPCNILIRFHTVLYYTELSLTQDSMLSPNYVYYISGRYISIVEEPVSSLIYQPRDISIISKFPQL